MVPIDLDEMIIEHYGITRTELARALESLPAIRPHAAALPEAEAALFDESDFAEDERAYARVTVETLGRTARLISTAYSASEVAERLGVNESRVRQRRAGRTLWAIQDRGGWVFPALQFEDEAGPPRSDPGTGPGVAGATGRPASSVSCWIPDHPADRPEGWRSTGVAIGLVAQRRRRSSGAQRCRGR